MAALRPAVDFSFDAVDDAAVTAEATRGMPTVLAFVTTSSLPSQAQVDFLIAMAKHDSDRVHYAVVLLESEENRELAELYKKALSIPFPVALADPKTLAGASGFGDVSTVPVTIVLDRAGRVVWRMEGRVVKSGEMRAAMQGL
jgi:peroxiredoxin